MKIEDRTSIVIVDDHRIFRSGLQMLIDANPNLRVTGECDTIKQATVIIKRERPDIVLLDLNLEDGDSFEMISEIPRLSDQTQTIVLTSEKDQNIHYKCLKSGANGLVVKEKSSDVLFSAIEHVMRGDLWFESQILKKIVVEFTRPVVSEEQNNDLKKINSLTTREKEVITLVGEGLKNKAIAERLFISETTVRHHLTSIFSKLELSSRLELVIFAFKHKLAEVPG